MFTLLNECCVNSNVILCFATIHLNFEETVVIELYPEALLKSCRFHLDQSWWRKIQSIGPAKEYKHNGSDISTWLHHIFGLEFLRSEDAPQHFMPITMNSF